jgi:hypothetical protein
MLLTMAQLIMLQSMAQLMIMLHSMAQLMIMLHSMAQLMIMLYSMAQLMIMLHSIAQQMIMLHGISQLIITAYFVQYLLCCYKKNFGTIITHHWTLSYVTSVNMVFPLISSKLFNIMFSTNALHALLTKLSKIW